MRAAGHGNHPPMGLKDLFRSKKSDDQHEPDTRTDDEKIQDAQDAAVSGAVTSTAASSVTISSS